MAAPEIIWIDSDNILELLGLKNAVTDAFLNNATVTVTLKDQATDVEIAGQSWPLTMTYVPASDGDYRATLNYQLVLTEHSLIYADIVADGGAGLRRRWKFVMVNAFSME